MIIFLFLIHSQALNYIIVSQWLSDKLKVEVDKRKNYFHYNMPTPYDRIESKMLKTE